MRRTTLKELRAGRPAVLDFFAPWCKACPAAAKRLETFAGDAGYGDQCLFLLVNVDGGADAARKFAAEHGISRCVVSAVEDEDIPSDLYSVKGLPHHVLIGRDGTVVQDYEVELPTALDEVLRAVEKGA